MGIGGLEIRDWGLGIGDEEWRVGVPDRIRSSPVWDSIGYQKALFLYDLIWFDCEKLVKDLRGKAIAQPATRNS